MNKRADSWFMEEWMIVHLASISWSRSGTFRIAVTTVAVVVGMEVGGQNIGPTSIIIPSILLIPNSSSSVALLHLPHIPPALEGQEATINRPHPRTKRHWHLQPCGLSWMGIWRRLPKSSSRPQKYRRSRRRHSIHFPLIHQMMIHHSQH